MRFERSVADLEYLKKYVPAVFAAAPRPTVSSQFAHINTATVIAKMLDSGFIIASAARRWM